MSAADAAFLAVVFYAAVVTLILARMVQLSRRPSLTPQHVAADALADLKRQALASELRLALQSQVIAPESLSTKVDPCSDVSARTRDARGRFVKQSL